MGCEDAQSLTCVLHTWTGLLFPQHKGKKTSYIMRNKKLDSCRETTRLSSFHSIGNTPYPEKGATLFLVLTLPNVNRFSKFFIDILSSKCLRKRQWNILPHLKRVATLPFQMLDPKLNEANFHALPFQTVTQKCAPNNVNIIFFTDEKIFTVTTPKNSQNDRLYAYPSTKKKDVATKRLRTH